MNGRNSQIGREMECIMATRKASARVKKSRRRLATAQPVTAAKMPAVASSHDAGPSPKRTTGALADQSIRCGQAQRSATDKKCVLKS